MKTAPERLSDRDFLALVIAEAMYDSWMDGTRFFQGRRLDSDDLQKRAGVWADRYFEGKAS